MNRQKRKSSFLQTLGNPQSHHPRRRIQNLRGDLIVRLKMAQLLNQRMVPKLHHPIDTYERTFKLKEDYRGKPTSSLSELKIVENWDTDVTGSNEF